MESAGMRVASKHETRRLLRGMFCPDEDPAWLGRDIWTEVSSDMLASIMGLRVVG